MIIMAWRYRDGVALHKFKPAARAAAAFIGR
jgi:hypothetical protein